MKSTFKLLFVFILGMIASTSYGQEKSDSPLKKGEAYHVLIKDKLIYTTDIYSILDKYKGKTKLIVQNEKAEPRDYAVSKKGQSYLEDFGYLKIDSATPWAPGICKCWNGYHFVELGCGRARGDQSKCAGCCESMNKELPWYVLVGM